ncbi:hypothetical protein C8A00DRAFT_35890 [Chaetomidium leptoderma]|uniref:Uncharacterized protein n=1 Tax=Chaetomidium leptoderma TaxID=669021 RepID=A0AAN6VJS6_9PEZI|nr:hypothetical protein C8A00DRAFT_35890 [Chaetomidium leptoderma]
MRSPMPLPSPSIQSDGWDVVKEFGTSSHTRSRSPQRNDDNMSSSQVANALAESGIDGDSGNNNNNDNNIMPYPTNTHIPPSNGESASTETAGTNDTLMDLNSNNTLLHGPMPTPYTYPDTTSPELTQYNVARHQREQDQRYTGSIPGWVDGAGMGDRLMIDPSTYCQASMLSSMYSGAGGRSMEGRSGSSVATAGEQDWQMVPRPTSADEGVFGFGAWTDDDPAMASMMKRMYGGGGSC